MFYFSFPKSKSSLNDILKGTYFYSPFNLR